MRRKLFVPLLVLLLSLVGLPALAKDASSIRGYSAKAGYQYVTFGSYPTEADGKVKPILWRVLKTSKGDAYLLTEYLLFASPVMEDYTKFSGWETSDLFNYLNSTFKKDAFTAAEQAALVSRTEDKGLVTLISYEDMQDASIGFSNNDSRLAEGTPWAKRKRKPKKLTLYIYSKGHKYSPWWSRTRRTNPTNHQQRRVMDEGKLGFISTGNPDLGVRPAIYLDLDKVTIVSGKGTMESPYVLQSTAEAKEEKNTPKPTKKAATKTAKPTVSPKKTAKPTAKPASKKATATPKATKKASSKSKKTVTTFTAGANEKYIHKKFAEITTLTEEGFLPEGQKEVVYKDAENGLWLYVSSSLRIQIERKTGRLNKTKTRWYQARIFCRNSRELMDFFPVDESRYTNRYALAKPEQIASQHHLIFGMNSDYFIYRVAQAKNIKSYAIGIVIRNGKIYYDKPKKSSTLPPLDVMAFYPDGRVTVHQNGKTTAKALVAAGATDTISFGPILVEKGKISARASQFGEVYNPRSAFGMVEPGHYVAVVADGRLKRAEGIEGVTCPWLAKTMQSLDCQYAINLDGGATCTMIFMGDRLNRIGNYGSGAAGNREQNELFGIGTSSAVK